MLNVQIYTAPEGALLFDLIGRTRSLQFSTSKFGFASLQAETDFRLFESFRLYDRPGLPHVVVSDNAGIVWEGRLEEPAISNNGFSLTALGYWRALSDPLYTALWSASGVQGWREATTDDVARRTPQMYSMDTNNRLFIGLTKNTAYGYHATLPPHIGAFVYDAPHLGVRDITYVTFAYDYDLPANWVVRVVAWNNAWSSTVVNNVTTTGGAATGTFTLDLSATPRAKITIEIYNATGGTYTHTGETGAYYLRCTSVRLTSTGASCTSDEIASALVAYTNALNAGQLSSSTALIENPGLELYQEIYEDKRPAEILEYLTGLGDNQTPPRQWETGVWENRMLHFRPRGSAARAWYVDVTEVQLQRALGAMYNSVYALYQLEDGRTQRTAASTDTDSIAQSGVTRQNALRANTTSATQAELQRDTNLADLANPIPRVQFEFDTVYDAMGCSVKPYLVRSGDTITARNLPPSLSASVDRIRSGRIAETTYSAGTGKLRVTMESPIPRLDTLLAQMNNNARRVLFQSPRPGADL